MVGPSTFDRAEGCS